MNIMHSLNTNNAFIVFILNLLMIVTLPSFAKQNAVYYLSYDQVPLNSTIWQEVDMTYWTTINGQLYLNRINLLRPKAYLAQLHMNKLGQKLTLTLPEIGLNHNVVKITAIKPAPQFKVCQQKNCSAVIGLFKHYATNVKTYRFKDLVTNKIYTIHATPNHPFYVKNKHQFLPISEVSSQDQLVSKNYHLTKLICSISQLVHCGITYNHNHQPIMVYNLEIYQLHNYKVSKNNILVHNAPCNNDQRNESTTNQAGYNNDHLSQLTNIEPSIAQTYSNEATTSQAAYDRHLNNEANPSQLTNVGPRMDEVHSTATNIETFTIPRTRDNSVTSIGTSNSESFSTPRTVTLQGHTNIMSINNLRSEFSLAASEEPRTIQHTLQTPSGRRLNFTRASPAAQNRWRTTQGRYFFPNRFNPYAPEE